VIYLYLDRFGRWVEQRRNRGRIEQAELPLGTRQSPEFASANGNGSSPHHHQRRF